MAMMHGLHSARHMGTFSVFLDKIHSSTLDVNNITDYKDDIMASMHVINDDIPSYKRKKTYKTAPIITKDLKQHYNKHSVVIQVHDGK